MSDVASVSGSSDSGRAWEAEVGKPVVVKLGGFACQAITADRREPLPVGEPESATSCYTKGDLVSVREFEENGRLTWSKYEVRIRGLSLFFAKEAVFPVQSAQK